MSHSFFCQVCKRRISTKVKYAYSAQKWMSPSSVLPSVWNEGCELKKVCRQWKESLKYFRNLFLKCWNKCMLRGIVLHTMQSIAKCGIQLFCTVCSFRNEFFHMGSRGHGYQGPFPFLPSFLTFNQLLRPQTSHRATPSYFSCYRCDPCLCPLANVTQ